MARRSGKPDTRGYAVVKDRCEVCGSVIYGYMKLNVAIPAPRCQEHRGASHHPPSAGGDRRKAGQ